MTKSLGHLVLLISLDTRQAFYHRTAVLATVLSWCLRMGLTILLYHGIYQALDQERVNGISFSVAASSMIMYAVFSGFGTRQIYKVINQDFKTGVIEIWLNKPVAYSVLKIGHILGQNIPSACCLILTATVFWMTAGLPDVDHLGLRFVMGIPLLLMGIIVGSFLYTLVGLSVVWLHDASATFLIVDKMVMIFGGAYIPIAFFPNSIRMIAEFLPTGVITFASQIFYPDFFVNYPRFIGLLILWIIVLGFGVTAISRAMARRMTVNGG
jgi:ABC-2 type transport system permease protein